MLTYVKAFISDYLFILPCFFICKALTNVLSVIILTCFELFHIFTSVTTYEVIEVLKYFKYRKNIRQN